VKRGEVLMGSGRVVTDVSCPTDFRSRQNHSTVYRGVLQWAIMVSRPESALIIVGHGSTVNPDSDVPTYEHAEVIRRREIFGEVHCCFWKEEPSMREVLHMVSRDDIYVVPNFISEGYFTKRVIPREMNLIGPVTFFGDRMVKYCDPVGSHPRMTEVLLHRAQETAPELLPEETSLLIIGHGTSLNENSAVAVKEQVRRISELHYYAEVLAAFMEEMPLVTDWRTMTTTKYVVAVPFFISDGLHSYQDIPVLLGIEADEGEAASRREVFRRNPYQIDGRTLYYASAIGTEPLFADVILDQVARFDIRQSGNLVHA
jgi:sirohydrochlorin cobaltochelatase